MSGIEVLSVSRATDGGVGPDETIARPIKSCSVAETKSSLPWFSNHHNAKNLDQKIFPSIFGAKFRCSINL